MFKALGLNRNPFSRDYDEYLHVSGREAAKVRARAIALVEAGRDLWISGAAGSGRESFVASLANALSGTHPVVFPTCTPGGDGRGMLAALHGVVRGTEPPDDLMDLCEEVYKGLLDGFWQSPPVICVPSPDSLSAGDWGELEILSELSFMGRKLTIAIACGAGEAPLPGMETLPLAAPMPDALEEMLRARMALCGGAGLLEEEIPAVAAKALGYSDALKRCAEALNRVRYLGAFSAAETAVEVAPSLFQAESLGEVARLLDELSSDFPEQ